MSRPTVHHPRLRIHPYMHLHRSAKTALCDFLGIEYPICLAGMGGRWTPPELVAAVSNAGGLGVMGGSGIQVEELRQRIRKVRELTDKPFGVDLLLPEVTGAVER